MGAEVEQQGEVKGVEDLNALPFGPVVVEAQQRTPGDGG